MKINPDDYRIRAGKRVKLDKYPTRIDPLYKSEKHYREQLKEGIEELRDVQKLLYASNAYSVLLIFQGMDAAGKDSAIKQVMSGVDPQGCQVVSFKVPSVEELRHDFLWRTTCKLPERGMIGIFNRSYYEEVLVVRVHPHLLAAQGISPSEHQTKSFWKGRFQSIVDSERHLYRNGTRILKFFLHISKDEQRKRLLARIEDPKKNWKFNLGDIEERKRWDDYERAYEDCLASTSLDEAPWFMVPADDKFNARLIISRIILQSLKGLKMNYPALNIDRLKEIQEVRKLLQKNGGR